MRIESLKVELSVEGSHAKSGIHKRKARLASRLVMGIAGCALLAAVGCAGRPSIFPNSDPSLRRTSAQFAADAASRHPFKSDAPRGGEAVGRAEAEYGLKQLRLLNSSDQDWDNVEVWVNHKYVVFVPKMARQKLETINFQMLYDGNGESFPLGYGHGGTIDNVEIYRDGKMYDVPLRLAE